MHIASYFKQIPAMSPDEVREFLSQKSINDYNLIDVRQPAEYEQGHLPGALLIPIGELSSRGDELDRNKPTIVY